MGALIMFLKRVASSVLLIILLIMIIVKGRGFNINKIYNKSTKFIKKAAKEKKLYH